MPILKVLFACCLVFPCVFSCISTKEKDKEVYLQLNEQLEHSTEIIHQMSSIYFRHLDSKTFDPHMAEKATAWFTKASHVQQLTSTIFNYLENIKLSLKSTGNSNDDKLNKTLRSFISEISAIDTNMTREFKLQIDSLQRSQDSVLFFSSDLSSEAITCLLSKLQNRVSILENRLLTYCDNNIGSNYDGYYSVVPLINQNATHLTSDEELEINVGVGFYNYSNPKVYANGDSLKSIDGVFNYKMKVSGKQGKYSVPIKIQYYDNVEKITINKTVNYYVD